MTTLGMIILVSFIGLFVFAGMRLVPVYLNYMKVVGVVDGVRDELDGKGASPTQIRMSIERRFDIEDVKVIKAREIKVTVADGGRSSAADTLSGADSIPAPHNERKTCIKPSAGFRRRWITGFGPRRCSNSP